MVVGVSGKIIISNDQSLAYVERDIDSEARCLRKDHDWLTNK